MQDLPEFENVIRNALAAIDEVEPRRARMPVFGKLSPKPMGLIIDEWGVWHSDAAIEDGFSQHGTLRDAIFAACCLNLFHRYAARISMTNIAQVINCLQSLLLTQGTKMVLTPTFHVYEMYRDHQGARSLRVDPADAGSISASASLRGDSLLLTLVNRSQTEDTNVRLNVRAGRPREVSAVNLTATSTRAENTFEQTDRVLPHPAKVELEGQVMTGHLPARSVMAIRVRIS
jgi:alpha-N-arabinofuranosidase